MVGQSDTTGLNQMLNVALFSFSDLGLLVFDMKEIQPIKNPFPEGLLSNNQRKKTEVHA